jgi:hypothetical protein
MKIKLKGIWVVAVLVLCCVFLIVFIESARRGGQTDQLAQAHFGEHHQPTLDSQKVFMKEDAMPKRINVEMVYDFACPWCYVGKLRLNEAIKQRPDLDIVLNWQPFQLNPGMPREGRNRWEYYRSKFGEAGAGNHGSKQRQDDSESLTMDIGMYPFAHADGSRLWLIDRLICGFMT